MRILHAIDEVLLHKGGVVRAVLDLVRGLTDAGASITLVTGNAKDVPAEWLNKKEGCPHVSIIDRSVTPTLHAKKASHQLKELIEQQDVVHLHTPWDPLHPAMARTAHRVGKPYALSVHGMLDDWCMAEKSFKKRAYLHLFGRKLMRQASWVHFTAEAERDQAMRWASGATPFVAPLLMDLSPYKNLPGPKLASAAFPELGDERAPRLLFLSRVDRKKGVDTLIRTVSVLAQEGHPTRAFIAGPGDPVYLDELRRLSEELNVSDRIHFLGMISGDLKWSLYEACDLFVLPTHQENFGIVLVESIACGLKTLTTKCVDIWQELQGCGAVIVDDDVSSFGAGLRTLLSEMPFSQPELDRNRDAVFDWLDPPRVIARYLDAYTAAIERREPPQS